jgi:hypothetical protein
MPTATASVFRDAGNAHGPQRIEEIDFNAFGGADNITINDLSATDVSVVNPDLNVTATRQSIPSSTH